MSGTDPKGYTKKVKCDGQPVAIKGASFGSQGDVASKGTGGGLVSANTHGPTKFVGPGSMDTRFEGGNVQLLGDPMLNNCGPSGSPANSATMMGAMHAPAAADPPFKCGVDCAKNEKEKGWDDCNKKELCSKVKELNERRDQGKLKKVPGASKDPAYAARKDNYKEVFELVVNAKEPAHEPWVKEQFFDECAYDKWNKSRNPTPSKRPPAGGPEQANPDHVHDAALGGDLMDINNFKWLSSSVNKSIGGALAKYDPSEHGKITTDPSCGCE